MTAWWKWLLVAAMLAGAAGCGSGDGDDDDRRDDGIRHDSVHRIQARPVVGGTLLDIEFADPDGQVVNLVDQGRLVSVPKSQLVSAAWNDDCVGWRSAGGAGIAVPFDQSGTVRIQAPFQGVGLVSVTHRDGREFFVNIDAVQIVGEDGLPVSVDRNAGRIMFGLTAGEPFVCAPQSIVTAFRAFNHVRLSRIWTISGVEREFLSIHRDWNLEGPAFRVLNRQEPGSVPVFRVHHPDREHFLTASPTERADVLRSGGWIDEGIAFWAYPFQAPGTLPVWRLWNDDIQRHHLVISPAERDNAISQFGFRLEGIAFFALP